MSSQPQSIGGRRLLKFPDVVREEFRMQQIDTEFVCQAIASQEFDHEDRFLGIMRIQLPDGRVLVLRGFKHDDEYILDDYSCQMAG